MSYGCFRYICNICVDCSFNNCAKTVLRTSEMENKLKYILITELAVVLWEERPLIYSRVSDIIFKICICCWAVVFIHKWHIVFAYTYIMCYDNDNYGINMTMLYRIGARCTRSTVVATRQIIQLQFTMF